MKKVINQVFITILLLTGILTCQSQTSNVSIEMKRSYGQIAIDIKNQSGEAVDLNYIVIQDNILMFTSGDVRVPPYSTSSVTISLQGAQQSSFGIRFSLKDDDWNQEMDLPTEVAQEIMLN